jgi:uncharacterized protein (TIGR02145 family)
MLLKSAITRLFSSEGDVASIRIGTQTWMKKNLDVARIRNGDPIQEITSNEEWEKAGEEGMPAWCYYYNDPALGKKYGRLYNWHAVSDPRGLAPARWRIPAKAEVKLLALSVQHDGNRLKAHGQGRNKGTGTDDSGFSAVLAGSRNLKGEFEYLLDAGSIWTSSATGTHLASCMMLIADTAGILIEDQENYKHAGLSIRCIKESVNAIPFTVIGDQFWMSENLAVSKFRNGDAIPEAKSDHEWIAAGERGLPAWCFYNNDIVIGEKLGKLYNWHAVRDRRGLAPEGWRVPAVEDIKSLIETVRDDGKAMKAIGEGKGDAAGTHVSGFGALLAGYRYCHGGGSFFAGLDHLARFWSSTDSGGSTHALHFFLNDIGSGIGLREEHKEFGLSVRCLKK